MNQYEIAVLYDPGLEVDLSKAEERVLKIFSTNKGEVLSKDNWGKRKLAYKIKKHDHALYVFYQVKIDPKNIRQIETTLSITDEVIRFLITKPDLKAIEKAEQLRKEKKVVADSSEEETKDSEEE